MKLLKLNIVNYRLFENLMIDFDKDDIVTTIIGRNGSGKTTLIECLTRIFSELLKCDTVDQFKAVSIPFDFSITYLLRKEKTIETTFEGYSFVNYVVVEINKTEQLDIKLYEANNVIEGWENLVRYTRDNGDNLKYLLPDNLIVYYSGIAEVLLNLYQDFQNKIILGSLDGDVRVEQPFYFFIPENLEPIILGLLLFEFGDIPDKLREKFGIQGFSQIVIKFKKPKWAKSKKSSEEYWGAKGGLHIFLTTLKDAANSVNFSTNNIEFIFTDRNSIETVREYYRTEKRVFEYLVALQANDLVESIKITLIKNDIETDAQRLSEGEKQLLIITGLRELLAGGNTLFLLDEPDTYLHPEWKRAFVYEFFKEDDRFQNFTIVTSHSPNIISGLKKGQLKILKNENGKSVLKHFTINPYGKPVDQILIDFFGVKGLRYKGVEDELNTLWELVKNNKYAEPEFEELFKKLEEEIGKDDEELTALKIEVIKRSKENETNRKG